MEGKPFAMIDERRRKLPVGARQKTSFLLGLDMSFHDLLQNSMNAWLSEAKSFMLSGEYLHNDTLEV